MKSIAKVLSVVIFLSLATTDFAQTGKKGSAYPQITTVPPTYLFWLIVPGVTNYTIAFLDLQNQISNTVFKAVGGATNGNFVLISSGVATNLGLWGITAVQEVDATSFYPTNIFIGTNWPPPVAPTTFGQAFPGNSNGVLYFVNSKVDALVWTKTNLISSP